MDIKTALGAAGGIALTIAGATTALFLTVGQSPSAASPEPAAVVTEYVSADAVVETPVATMPLDVDSANSDELVAAAPYDEYEEEEPAEVYAEEHEYEEEDEHEEPEEYEDHDEEEDHD